MSDWTGLRINDAARSAEDRDLPVCSSTICTILDFSSEEKSLIEEYFADYYSSDKVPCKLRLFNVCRSVHVYRLCKAQNTSSHLN